MLAGIFSCDCWPSICLWRDVWLSLLLIFDCVVWVFCIKLYELFTYFENKSLVNSIIYKYVFPVHRLSFQFVYGFFCYAKVEEIENINRPVAAAAAKSLQSCLTVWPHRRQLVRLPCPWDSPGKNTGVGCHFLLQCMKVKSKSEVTQSCLTLSDPMDRSLPGSSIHGIFQARVLEWGAIAFSEQTSYQ